MQCYSRNTEEKEALFRIIRGAISKTFDAWIQQPSSFHEETSLCYYAVLQWYQVRALLIVMNHNLPRACCYLYHKPSCVVMDKIGIIEFRAIVAVCTAATILTGVYVRVRIRWWTSACTFCIDSQTGLTCWTVSRQLWMLYMTNVSVKFTYIGHNPHKSYYCF